MTAAIRLLIATVTGASLCRSTRDMCLSTDFTDMSDGALGKTGNFQKAGKMSDIQGQAFLQHFFTDVDLDIIF